MEKGVLSRKLLIIFASAVLVLCMPFFCFAVVLHPGAEPDIADLTSLVHEDAVGRWGSNASCVAISPDCIITTRHQGGGVGTNIVIGATTYKVSQLINLSVDLRVVRITTLAGDPANLTEYAQLYTGAGESGQDIILGGYGKGRGVELQTGGETYGYAWADEGNTTLRWATNEITGTATGNTSYGLTDLLYADFDDLPGNMTNPQKNSHDPTDYEGIQADHDSGAGWFLENTGELVAIIAYLDPANDREESWFRDPCNPSTFDPDVFYGIKISSYDDEITPIIGWMPNAVIISGYVLDHLDQPLENTYINANNTAGYTMTDSNGFYKIHVPDGWSGTLYAAKTGYSFSSLSPFTNLQEDISGQNFVMIINQNVSDDFNDNTKSANWLNVSEDYPNINISETDQKLQFISTGDSCDVKAYYTSNEWYIDTTTGFSIKLDFHHFVADVNDNFAYLKLISDVNNYAHIAVGSDSDGQYYQIEVIENSDVNEIEKSSRTNSDGTLYVYYRPGDDRLYLSLAGYNTTINGLYAKNALAKSWINGMAKIEIGMVSKNCEILPGQASFDNFIMNTGILLDWPPVTDIDQSGFIDYNDLRAITDDWLTNDPNSPADITDDNDVNFEDFSKFSNVW